MKTLKSYYLKHIENKFVKKKITLLDGTLLKCPPLEHIYRLQTQNQKNHESEILSELGEYTSFPRTKVLELLNQIDENVETCFSNKYDKNAPEKFYREFQFYYFHLAKTDLRFRHYYVRLNILLTLAHHFKLRSVADFGAGIGRECTATASKGFDTTHIDLPGPLRDFAQWRYKRRNLTVQCQSPEEFKKDNTQFDLIMSFDVLEHMVNPLETLPMWDKKLKPGGLIITYPDFHNDGTALHLDYDKDIIQKFHDFFDSNNYKKLFDRKMCYVFRKPLAH